MAETPHSPGPHVVRLSVTRPATTALATLVLGGALLLGGGAVGSPPTSTGATAPPTGAHAVAPYGPDWDVTPRDLLVDQRRDGALAFVQVVATRLGAPLDVANDQAAAAALPGASLVPDVLWSAYRSAAASVPQACHLPVGLVAAIGQVESGSLVGRGLDNRHRAVPAVFGPVLDGHGYAAIPDTDGGRWDHDTTWDRAVGPMQFIPSTWARWGRDGNGDGTRDPQNVEDAAWSAAAYLCAGGRDLSTSAGLRAAVLSYNHSSAYLADVLRLARTMTPGGALPQVAAAPGWAPPPFVGPPSRPPVVTAPRTAEVVEALGGSPSPTTSDGTTTAVGGGTSTSTTSASTTSATSSPTSRGTTTSTSPSRTTTTSSTTSVPASTTTSPTSSTTSPTSCPNTSTTTTTGTTTSTTTTTTSTSSPSSSSSSSSSTNGTPDPCATTPDPTTTATTTTSTTSANTNAAATTTSTEGPTRR